MTANLEMDAEQIRRDIVTMIHRAGSGHSGGSLSAVEILTCLYGAVMRHDPGNPEDSCRDRFILSKGHAAPALYAVLSHYGYFPKEELMTLRCLGSRLQGHPCRDRLPGIELSTGSLGLGISAGLGMALASGISGDSYRVFVLCGDGELNEGQNWEAFMAMNMEAKQRGLQFNDKETNLIVSILTSGMAPEEKKKLDILKMLSKKMAGPR